MPNAITLVQFSYSNSTGDFEESAVLVGVCSVPIQRSLYEWSSMCCSWFWGKCKMINDSPTRGKVLEVGSRGGPLQYPSLSSTGSRHWVKVEVIWREKHVFINDSQHPSRYLCPIIVYETKQKYYKREVLPLFSCHTPAFKKQVNRINNLSSATQWHRVSSMYGCFIVWMMLLSHLMWNE